jgi:hypothetical protein
MGELGGDNGSEPSKWSVLFFIFLFYFPFSISISKISIFKLNFKPDFELKLQIRCTSKTPA